MKNWRTTLAGFGAAVLHLYANGLSLKAAATAAGIAAVGAMAKDAGVTGVGANARRP